FAFIYIVKHLYGDFRLNDIYKRFYHIFRNAYNPIKLTIGGLCFYKVSETFGCHASRKGIGMNPRNLFGIRRFTSRDNPRCRTFEKRDNDIIFFLYKKLEQKLWRKQFHELRISPEHLSEFVFIVNVR